MSSSFKHTVATGLAAVLATLAIATPVFAQDAAPAQKSDQLKKLNAALEERFNAADANHDGKLTREEAQKMPRVASNFDAIDTDKRGYLTLDQIRQFGLKAVQDRGGSK
jgi:Ca2+-binding EF-hand superfamily protein